ncbi:SusC/RagA family TonB-linked outer membrane protein [Taibaiella helva]|uniref:SusC/RagA family TonB-linked outer membrane protein n=1 Tax=Taibaiella helva TaxID=2301235 RepID=UPI000E58609A|nr:SusC/RagA family TonB-linked outer membrane protein [Taibaiella helva]
MNPKSTLNLPKRAWLRPLLFGASLGLGLSARPEGLRAQDLGEKISLRTERTQSLATLLSRIDQQTGYSFSFLREDFEAINVAPREFKAERLEAILKTLQKEYHLEYTINNGVILLRLSANKAQSRSKGYLYGRVSDERNGEALIGAIVSIAQQAVQTDVDGKFVVALSPGEYTAKLSYMGYNDLSVQQIRIGSGDTTATAFKLKPASNDLNEVVVTALGIKREEKALGYSVTRLDNEDVTDAMSNNWTNTMEGKVAGLNMLKSNGGPAGTNAIILRGENSLSGNSQALIVVDGVVISGSSGQITGNGSGAYLDGDSPVDFGTSLNDINPDDIESVSVLKGPGASALYGARGANGAIIVTTKSGKKQKGLGLTFNSNTTFESILQWPDFQYEYGQGVDGSDTWYSYGQTIDGASTRSTSSAWGPKFDGQSYFQYNPVTRTADSVRTPWVPYKNNRKNFFQTARTFTNTLTLEGGSDKTTARLSYTNLDNKWIVPNTGYSRNTVALALDQYVTPRLKISTHINYTNKSSDNLPTTGYNNQSIMYFIRGLVPNANLDWFRDYWAPGQENIMQTRPFSSLLDNPYLIANEMLNKVNRNNVIGNITANYQFTRELSLMARTTLDWASEARSQQRPFSSQKFASGMYRTQNIFTQELNYDFLLNYNKVFKKNFVLNASLGGSRMHNKFISDEMRAEQLLYPGVYNFANSKNLILALPYRSEYAVNSLYGTFGLSFRDYLFLDVTGRNDWTSTLATPESYGHSSFFYPSVNLSGVLTEMAHLPKWVSFWKLRGSWAQVGSGGTTPYLTAYTYSPTSFPSGLANPTDIANSDLRPLITTSYEAGTDLRLFRNRVGVDVALYLNNTRNQIISVPIDRAAGYNATILNAGLVQNKGIEIEAYIKPFVSKKKDGFNWRSFGTYAANRNKIVDLAEGVTNYIMSAGPAGRGTIEARPGGTMGDLYGIGYQRSPDGKIVYDASGYPLWTDTAIYIGNTTPKWRASWGNEFTYKNFRFSFLFDGQFGGVGYSLTHSVLAEEGKLTKTLPGRYNGIVGDGVIRNDDGSYRPNDVIAADIQTYYKSHFDRTNIESNTFSTDYIKLREVRLDYKISSNKLKGAGIRSLVVGLYGRDLLMFSDWPAYDPQFGTLGDGQIYKGFEIGQFPSTRSYGFNIKAEF